MDRLDNKTNLHKEIFGDSDDEEDLKDLEINFSDDEEKVAAPKKQPLPKFKRISDIPQKGKREKKRHLSDDPVEAQPAVLDPAQIKLNEATKDFDAAVSRIKPKRFKKSLDEEAQIDDMSTEMLKRMKTSADMDHEWNRMGQIATEKIKLLPYVVHQFSKTHYHEQYLENQILEGVKAWLEPMHGNGSLPPINVQKEMMKALEQMPIRTDQLRESGIAMFYAKCDLVESDVKRRIKDLLDKWMRPIMNRSDDYKDRIIVHADYDAEKSSAVSMPKKKDVSVRTEQLISTMIQNRARLPNKSTTNYNVAPMSNVNAVNETKLSDKQRKLKNKMLMMKRK